jgi:hypothetical protein
MALINAALRLQASLGKFGLVRDEDAVPERRAAE